MVMISFLSAAALTCVVSYGSSAPAWMSVLWIVLSIKGRELTYFMGCVLSVDRSAVTVQGG